MAALEFAHSGQRGGKIRSVKEPRSFLALLFIVDFASFANARATGPTGFYMLSSNEAGMDI